MPIRPLLSVLSGWDTWVCRWFGLLLALGFEPWDSTSTQKKVDVLAAGRSYIEHISSQWIAECVNGGKFEPTADMKRLNEADVLLICVPTPLSDSRDPDLKYVESTTRFIAQTLRPGQLVVLESTTYPGTTRDVMLPILAESGLTVGQDYFLAYSPEREDPGNPDFSAEGIPKVVGGIDAESLRLAELVYQQAVVRVIPVSSCEVAEACKILENTYRSVNIAMVNELKMLFNRLGIDVWGSYRGRENKTLRLPGIFPRPGLGWALHSHRPLLSELGCPQTWHAHAVH